MNDPGSQAAAAARPAVDEFAGVPSPRTRHPALAMGVVALAAFLIYHERADFRYALSSGEPRALGDARALFAAGAPPPEANRFVRISGLPDRESAVQLDTQGSWQFSQLFRVLGTRGKLFVHRMKEPLPAHLVERDEFEGRLVHLRDLPFRVAIRGYFARHVSATHFFKVEDLLSVTGRQAASLQDLAGDRVKVGPADVLGIDLLRPGEIRIALPHAVASDAAAARALVEKHGGTPVGEPELSGSHHVLVASFAADRRDAALAALADLDRRVDIRPARRTVRARLSDLSAQGDALSIKQESGAVVSAPVADVQTVRILAAVDIPPDALLLVEGDGPRQHLPTVAVITVLAAFAIVNVVGLLRGLRHASS